MTSVLVNTSLEQFELFKLPPGASVVERIGDHTDELKTSCRDCFGGEKTDANSRERADIEVE